MLTQHICLGLASPWVATIPFVPRHDPLTHVAQTFGALLQRLRKARGMTQEELAHRAELDVSFVSRMERGLTQPSIGIFLRIAEALEISPARLITDVERIANR